MSIGNTSLTGASGEHYVMYKLLSMGYVAGLAPEGAPNADIIVTDIKTKKSVAIQVKTRMQKGADHGWHMKEKHEGIKEDNLFYCFVDLPAESEKAPTVYVMPSKIVAEAIYKAHRIWLATPGKKGQAHKKTEMRRLLPDYTKTLPSDNPAVKKYNKGWLNKYKENWGLLNLGK